MFQVCFAVVSNAHLSISPLTLPILATTKVSVLYFFQVRHFVMAWMFTASLTTNFLSAYTNLSVTLTIPENATVHLKIIYRTPALKSATIWVHYLFFFPNLMPIKVLHNYHIFYHPKFRKLSLSSFILVLIDDCDQKDFASLFLQQKVSHVKFLRYYFNLFRQKLVSPVQPI